MTLIAQGNFLIKGNFVTFRMYFLLRLTLPNDPTNGAFPDMCCTQIKARCRSKLLDCSKVSSTQYNLLQIYICAPANIQYYEI